MRIDTLREATSVRLAVIATDATIRAAACGLARPGVGLLVVCQLGGEAAGVLSSSDLVRYLASSGPADAPVATLMSCPIVSVRPEDDLHDAWAMMVAKGLQNAPILGTNSKPLGVLDIRDALNALFAQEERQEQMLANYIMGIGYR